VRLWFAVPSRRIALAKHAPSPVVRLRWDGNEPENRDGRPAAKVEPLTPRGRLQGRRTQGMDRVLASGRGARNTPRSPGVGVKKMHAASVPAAWECVARARDRAAARGWVCHVRTDSATTRRARRRATSRTTFAERAGVSAVAAASPSLAHSFRSASFVLLRSFCFVRSASFVLLRSFCFSAVVSFAFGRSSAFAARGAPHGGDIGGSRRFVANVRSLSFTRLLGSIDVRPRRLVHAEAERRRRSSASHTAAEYQCGTCRGRRRARHHP